VTLTAIPQANPSVVFQEFPDEGAVLVNLDTGGSVALNTSGWVVWKLLDGRRTVGEIVAGVERAFKQVPDTAANDVVALIDTLAEDGFIGHELPLSEPSATNAARTDPKANP
jgi:hypothetical protein